MPEAFMVSTTTSASCFSSPVGLAMLAMVRLSAPSLVSSIAFHARLIHSSRSLPSKRGMGVVAIGLSIAIVRTRRSSRVLKKIQHLLIEFIAVLHVRPMAAARKDMHARIGQAPQHEQPDVERAGSIILPPHHQRLGFHFKQVEI